MGRGVRDGVEDAKDLAILLLQVLNLLMQLLVFSSELEKVSGHFNVLELVTELFDELVNVLVELSSHLHQARPDLVLPLLDDSRILDVRVHSFGREVSDSFEVFHLFLVAFVNIK